MAERTLDKPVMRSGTARIDAARSQRQSPSANPRRSKVVQTPAVRGKANEAQTKSRPRRPSGTHATAASGAQTRVAPKRRQLSPAPGEIPVSVARSPGVNFSLSKLFLLSGFFVGATLVVICALDMVLGVPLFGASTVFDAGFLFSGALLLYLSWNARDEWR